MYLVTVTAVCIKMFVTKGIWLGSLGVQYGKWVLVRVGVGGSCQLWRDGLCRSDWAEERLVLLEERP